MKNLRTLASKALDANPGCKTKIQEAGPKGQYKACSKALAALLAKKAEVSTHEATWALVNAVNDEVDTSEINDF